MPELLSLEFTPADDDLIIELPGEADEGDEQDGDGVRG
jgi:hypothetical protein